MQGGLQAGKLKYGIILVWGSLETHESHIYTYVFVITYIGDWEESK